MSGRRGLRVALVSVDYPPQRTSAAVQMRDLAIEMLRQGHRPTIIVPTADLAGPWSIETMDGIEVLRIKAPPTRDIGYARRTLNEAMLPLTMSRAMAKTPLRDERWDLIAWYSPTIFFGPFIWWLKRRSGATAYLILRDIFPEWAVDLGLMKKGPVYWFFRAVAQLQYNTADTIGVQTGSNLAYLERWAAKPGRTLEVLPNWLSVAPNVGCRIDFGTTNLSGRKVFAYIGNMGVAQGMDILLDMAELAGVRDDIGFAFVGRGSEAERIRRAIAERGLANAAFFDEIPSEEVPGLLAQCHAGLIALDPRHRSHNVPGKFLSYLRAGLPVLARVNKGTDLARLINDEQVGLAISGDAPQQLVDYAIGLCDDSALHEATAARCRDLGERAFSPAATVAQITAHAAGAQGPAGSS